MAEAGPHSILPSLMKLFFPFLFNESLREGSSTKQKRERKVCPGKIQPLETWSCPDSEKIIASRFDEGFIVLTF